MFVIPVALLAIIVSGVCFLRRAPSGREEVHLPGADRIKAMNAVIFDNRERMRIPPIPEFAIPSKYIPVVLCAISPAERFDYPAEWDDLWALGEIDITTTGMQHFKFASAKEEIIRRATR